MLADECTQLQKTEIDMNTVPHQRSVEVNLRLLMCNNRYLRHNLRGSCKSCDKNKQKTNKTQVKLRKAKCRIAIKLPEEVAHFPYIMLQ